LTLRTRQLGTKEKDIGNDIGKVEVYTSRGLDADTIGPFVISLIARILIEFQVGSQTKYETTDSDSLAADRF